MFDMKVLEQLMLPKHKREKVVKPLDFTRGYALVRTDAGIEKVPMSAEVKASIGKFESRQGTLKRSRKGRTSRMPNGYAKYNSITELDVVSYHIVP
jgi:hypothetical protein